MPAQLSPRLVGLALSQSLQLSGLLQWMVRQSAEVENNMVSVERMVTYTRLEQEPATVAGGGGAPPEGWPGAGDLAYEGVTAVYRPGLPPVLRGLTFHLPVRAHGRGRGDGACWGAVGILIFRQRLLSGYRIEHAPAPTVVAAAAAVRPQVSNSTTDSPSFLSFLPPRQGGTSCGVVGRTGSGKSSLLLSFFRLIPVTEGRVLLGGMDVAAVGLDALRRQLAVIPQDPVLFSGEGQGGREGRGGRERGEREGVCAGCVQGVRERVLLGWWERGGVCWVGERGDL